MRFDDNIVDLFYLNIFSNNIAMMIFMSFNVALVSLTIIIATYFSSNCNTNIMQPQNWTLIFIASGFLLSITAAIRNRNESFAKSRWLEHF